MKAAVWRVGVGVGAVMLAAVTWHTLIEDFGFRNETAAVMALGAALGPLMCLYWPVAAWVGSLVLASAAAWMAGVVWPAPYLAVHVSVLAVAAFRARDRMLAIMWLATLGCGVVLGFALELRFVSMGTMSVLSGTVLAAVWAVRGRHEAMRGNAEARERAALLEERARIARELHDVVAHHMSVVAVQAEAAPYRVANPPAELVRGFEVIRASALEAMTELHRVLHLLRSGEGETGPPPSIDQLDELVDRVRQAGSPVSVRVEGTPVALPVAVGLSAYRIAQEALSNVLKHARGAEVGVRVKYTPGGVEVVVENGPGHGLTGMRERTAMLGGDLVAGAREDGGFTVRARLPLEET